MAHDTYYQCPCGSGKKVKFCCGRPVAAELEQILRAISGDQRIAALNLIRSARSKVPDNPALLTLQIQLLLDLDEPQQLEESLAALAQASPQSSVVPAVRALCAAEQNQMEEAVERLQDALEAATDKVINHYVYEAIGVVGQVLLLNERFAGAFAHFFMQTVISPDEDRRPQQILHRFCRLPNVPVALRYFRVVKHSPEAAERSSREWLEAAESASNGVWRKAASIFETFLQQDPQDAATLYNLGLMRMSLGQDTEAARHFRDLSRLPGLSRDESIEAEALVQLLDRPESGGTIDRVETIYGVDDIEGTTEQLLSDRHFRPLQADLPEMAVEGEPPPRAAFIMLDRENPPAEAEVDWQGIPELVGELILYGRQTDREARLVLRSFRDEEYEARKAQLTELLGDRIRPISEEVNEKVDAIQHALIWSWAFPTQMTPEQRREAVATRRRHVLVETVPHVPMASLGGLSPAEAAKNEDLRLPLLGSILNIEMECTDNGWDLDVNDLREKLGLPRRETLDSPLEAPAEMPLERMPAIDPARLTNEELLPLFARSLQAGFLPPTQRLVEEMEQRGDAFKDKIHWPMVYATFAQETENPETAVEWLGKAQAAMEARGESPAQFMLGAIPQHLAMGDVEKALELITTIQSKHMNEPGIQQGLYRIVNLMDAMVQGGMPGGPAAKSGPGTPGGAAAPAPSGLWTPGGGTPGGGTPAAAQGDKPKLWVPGMD